MSDLMGQSLSSSTEVEVIKASFTWTINNFSFLSTEREKKIKSPVFQMGDNNQFKWRLRLYPNGCEDGSDTHISLFLQLVSHAEAEVLARFDFAIIKANGYKHVLASHKIRSYTQWKSLGYHELIDRSYLLDVRNGLLLNDCLRLVCEIHVGTGTVASKTTSNDSSMRSAIEKNLMESFESLLYSQIHSDLTLLAGSDGRFPVHKAVLAVRSPVFAAMFEHDMQERNHNEVVIADVERDVLEELIRFVYTGRAERLETLAGGLLAAADKYAIDDLRLVCEREISRSLSLDNAFDALLLADRHNSLTLRGQVVAFMKANAVHFVDILTSIVLNPNGMLAFNKIE